MPCPTLHGPPLKARDVFKHGSLLSGNYWPPRVTSQRQSTARRFREVMLPHLDAAYSLARYLAADATAAEDIVQEAFLNAFRAFGTYQGGSAKAWL
ncbi:sigma factor, partial [Pseudomonas sp. RA_15y_Pfl1_P11]|uniref:sigma factor n=1 Tax=Pseudomonas sp. RA_15y_Pfl1_P11 TaxID=3088702 RepID=UPI00403F6AE6